MKKTISALMICILLFSLAACQPTPDEDIVVQKDAERMVEKAPEGELAGTAAIEVPTDRYRYSQTGADGNLSVEVDAAIDVPVSENIPIIRVESAGFEQSAVTHIFNTLFAGQQVKDSTDNIRTKDDVARELRSLEQQLSDGTYLEAGFSLEEWEAMIAALQDEYNTVPEDGGATPGITDGTMHLVTDDDRQFYSLSAIAENSSLHVRSNLSNNADGESYLMYHRFDMPSYSTMDAVRLRPGDALAAEAEAQVSLPLTSAIDQCDALLAGCGINAVLAAAFLVNDRAVGYSDGIVAPAKHYGYKLYYIRDFDGLPTAVNAAFGMYDDPYNLTWYYEQIEVVIDADGFVSVNWKAPITVLNALKENVCPISWLEARAIFEKMVFQIYEPRTAIINPELTSLTFDVDVDEVQFRLMRIREQNTEGTRQGILTPVWVFYGTVKEEKKWNDASRNDLTYTDMSTSGNSFYPGPSIVLAINAVDGSLIDTSLGY